MLTIKRILVATDFSEASERAIDYALELASTFGASLVIAHAYDIPVVGFPDGVLIASPNVATQIETSAQESLKAVVNRRSGTTVHIDAVLRQGAVAEEVNKLAAEMDVDMIILGTHGRRGIAHAILGSVAERIVRTATRPVLVLHEAPQQKAA